MKVHGFIFSALLALVPTAKASITFNATFDSSLTSAEDTAITNALNVISSSISSPNNITDKLYFTSMGTGRRRSFTGATSM